MCRLGSTETMSITARSNSPTFDGRWKSYPEENALKLRMVQKKSNSSQIKHSSQLSFLHDKSHSDDNHLHVMSKKISLPFN